MIHLHFAAPAAKFLIKIHADVFFLFRLSRICYYTNIELAMRFPEEFLSLIQDGMDQRKTDMPAEEARSKQTECNPRVKTHVTGVMANGIGNFLYLDTKQFGKGADLTLTVMVLTLKRLMQYYTEKKMAWPHTLFYQLDNACSENKNRFFFRFCGLLVYWGIFEEVCLLLLFLKLPRQLTNIAKN